MNLKELDSLQLADYVKFHDELNPVLWDQNQKINPKVREILLNIANDFQEFLGVNDIGLKDITVSGSNAGYNYNDHSDIDLHLVVDLPEADRNQVYRELFDAKKYQYNDQHNISVGGHDVELYVQNANQPHYSQGIYSLLNDQWLTVPKKIKTDINDDSVISKYHDLENRINSTVESHDLIKVQSLIDKIKHMRSTGLANKGEFSVENLTFKLLRHDGLIKKLYDHRNQLRDQQLSLNERKKRRKSPRVRYGHGGYWYPGFSWAASEGGGEGGGGESINEDIESQIKLFANEIMDDLGIVDRPKIILHSDSSWTADTGSFGQYDPEKNHLQLAISNRHILDIIRTLAHELVHCAQRHQGEFPDDAGQTGSPYEDQANALAGRIMRGFADRRPELFKDIKLSEASGYIPTEKEKKDPRFSTALTQDIRPGEIGRQANKLNLKTDSQGRPELLMIKKLQEEWSNKYKKSIDCDNPRGFSQRAHCQGKQKINNESQQDNPNLKIYLDMDGVLANFSDHYRKLFGVEPTLKSKDDPHISKILGTDFFKNLEKFSTSDDVVKLALKYGGNRYGICSSPLRGDFQNSSDNKKQWLLLNLSPLPNKIIFTRKKEKYAVQDGHSNVLIDDKLSNIEKWNAAGGHGILYDAKQHTIQYLEDKLKKISNQKKIRQESLDLAHPLTWSSLDEGLSVEDKMIIFEEYFTKGNLTESVDIDKKDYFLSLAVMSDTPTKNKTYIVVPMALVSNKVMLLDKPSYMEFLGGSQTGLVFENFNERKTYPSDTMRDLSVFDTFTFSSVDKYDKFRTALSLKFDTHLPNIDIEENGQQDVTESLNQPYELVGWDDENYDDEIRTYAALPDGTHLEILFSREDEDINEWDVEFRRGDSMLKTGQGLAPQIFATVLEAIKQFVKKVKPVEIRFSAIKMQDTTGSRSSLYDALAKRYAAGLGYSFKSADDGFNRNYVFRKIRRGVTESVGDDDVDQITNDFIKHYQDDPLSVFMQAKASYLYAVERTKDFSNKADDLYRSHGDMSREEFQNTVMKYFGKHLRNNGFPKHASKDWGEAEHQLRDELMNSDQPGVTENFADGRNPGRKGLSRRVGIPKKSTLGQLEKIAKSSTGERRRMAQWQLNMRRGRNKKK